MVRAPGGRGPSLEAGCVRRRAGRAAGGHGREDSTWHAHIRSPALLYGDFDEDTHRFVLVLEDLRDLQVPVQAAGVSAGRARLAVREIAKLHGQSWGAIDHPALSGCSDVLGPKFRRFMQVAYLLCLPVVLERFGNSFSPETRRVAEALGPRITAHFASVATGPRTFVHGDYRGETCSSGPTSAAAHRPAADRRAA